MKRYVSIFFGIITAALVIAFVHHRSRQVGVARRIEFLGSPEQGKNFTVVAGMKMIWIPSGVFQMGDVTGNRNFNELIDTIPTHEVRLTKGYWLGETEVTQAQWMEVMGNNPSYEKGGQLPVANVNWNDAVAFCSRLNEMAHASGHLLAEIEYRLPTEAQWEYACRAGTSGDFAGDLNAMAWYRSNSGENVHPVAEKRPNNWGLYDMHGNVGEWCFDLYEPYDVNHSPGSQIDPTGGSSGDDHVVRGGGVYSNWRHCSSAARERVPTEYTQTAVGFRVAAVLLGATKATTAAGMAPAFPRDERRLTIAEGHQAGAEQEVEIAKGVNVTMCWIPAGDFVMAVNSFHENDTRVDEMETQVHLSHGFWMAKTECTQKVWRAVMGSNPSLFEGEDLPVEQVSWNDCRAFISKLRQLEGWRFELPTEAQWEYACRAGITSIESANFEGETHLGVVAAFAELGWDESNSEKKTHPVGRKRPNAWGLQDMHGNVSEWCRDAYERFPPGSTDPEVKDGAARVFRGGSWLVNGWGCRSAKRYRNDADFRSDDLGLRLVEVQSTPSGNESGR